MECVDAHVNERFRRKEEISKLGHTNNKQSNTINTPTIYMYMYVYVSVYSKLTHTKKSKNLKMESQWFIIPLFHLSHDTGSHSEPPSQPQLHTQVWTHLGPIHTPVLQRARLSHTRGLISESGSAFKARRGLGLTHP